jgi:hypothetical protein
METSNGEKYTEPLKLCEDHEKVCEKNPANKPKSPAIEFREHSIMPGCAPIFFTGIAFAGVELWAAQTNTKETEKVVDLLKATLLRGMPRGSVVKEDNPNRAFTIEVVTGPENTPVPRDRPKEESPELLDLRNLRDMENGL